MANLIKNIKTKLSIDYFNKSVSNIIKK